jgi:hypothetical protein
VRMKLCDDYLIQVDEDTLREIEGRKVFEALVKDLNQGFYAQAILAQEGVRKEVLHLQQAASIAPRPDEAVRPKMVVSSADYHFWGQTLGYECWDDEEFCAEYLRDNSESRISDGTGRTTITAGTPWRTGGRIIVP